MADIPPLPDLMRARRRADGLSQVAAAAKVGIHQSTWSRWESGASRPHAASHLAALADFLDVPVGDLLPHPG